MYSLCTKKNKKKNQLELGHPSHMAKVAQVALSTIRTQRDQFLELGACFTYGDGGPSGPFHNKNTKGSVPFDCCSISHSKHTEYMI